MLSAEMRRCIQEYHTGMYSRLCNNGLLGSREGRMTSCETEQSLSTNITSKNRHIFSVFEIKLLLVHYSYRPASFSIIHNRIVFIHFMQRIL